jgi:hypothetical protein
MTDTRHILQTFHRASGLELRSTGRARRRTNVIVTLSSLSARLWKARPAACAMTESTSFIPGTSL